MKEDEVKIRSFNMWNFTARFAIFLLGVFCVYKWFEAFAVETTNNNIPDLTNLLVLASGSTLIGIALMLGGFSDETKITEEYIVKGRKPDWNE